MYQSREDQDELSGYAVASGRGRPAAALAFGQMLSSDDSSGLSSIQGRLVKRFRRFELATDLGADIGSARWFRGLGTMIGLTVAALAMWPDFAPLEAASPLPTGDEVQSEYRSQSVLPLALGGDTGRRMGATDFVRPLAQAPERPMVRLVATLAQGDSFDRALLRAGVGRTDALQIAKLVGGAIPLSDLEPGTRIDITLGRRPAPQAARSLEELSLRARFDLELTASRLDANSPLTLSRKTIRVDDTPLRIRGTVGDSLYRSARAAGAPASAVQAFLKTLSQQVDLDRDIRAGDAFDIIVSHRRAATGERQAGQLLFAGIDRVAGKPIQLMRWGKDGRFYEASGVGEQHSGLVAPVPGRISSNYGMRRHPILGYRRMHAGMDFKASHGTPIVAVTDGTIIGAGRMGGCGNAVRMRHGGGIDTRYCHMSRIAVNRGQSVRRGQVIGYVGSTGLSTGPHLHYEMYRGGRAVNPASVKFVTRAQLSGAELAQFRTTLARLKTVEAGAALADLAPTEDEVAADAPLREIDKLDRPTNAG